MSHEEPDPNPQGNNRNVITVFPGMPEPCRHLSNVLINLPWLLRLHGLCRKILFFPFYLTFVNNISLVTEKTYQINFFCQAFLSIIYHFLHIFAFFTFVNIVCFSIFFDDNRRDICFWLFGIVHFFDHTNTAIFCIWCIIRCWNL